MPKASRKRRPTSPIIQIETPKNKFKFDEAAQREEEQLGEILFGGSSSFLKSLEDAVKENVGQHSSDSGVGEDSEDSTVDKGAAWYDEDDEGIDVGQALASQGRKLPDGGINSKENKYARLLQQKYLSVVGTPNWAKLEKKRKLESDSDEDILTSVGFLQKTKKSTLNSGLIEFKKVKDLNCETYNEGPYINSIEFHPNSRVALVAGQRGIASLHAVDAKNNSKLHSVMFQRFPIFCAKFINNGTEALLGSRMNHVFSYDLNTATSIKIALPTGLTQCKKFTTSPDSQMLAIAGKWGEIHLLTSASKERTFTLKQNSEVTALHYGDTKLFSHSDTGEITIFDLRMNKVLHRFNDEGCLQGTTLAISSTNQFLAAGSKQGIVNLYRMDDLWRQVNPKPLKTLTNLTTSITDLKFNATAEMLAFSSVDIANSVKLFHLGSRSVFSNFPGFQTKLGYANVVNFSPNSGFFAVGNNSSIVSLFTLKHYKGY